MNTDLEFKVEMPAKPKIGIEKNNENGDIPGDFTAYGKAETSHTKVYVYSLESISAENGIEKPNFSEREIKYFLREYIRDCQRFALDAEISGSLLPDVEFSKRDGCTTASTLLKGNSSSGQVGWYYGTAMYTDDGKFLLQLGNRDTEQEADYAEASLRLLKVDNGNSFAKKKLKSKSLIPSNAIKWTKATKYPGERKKIYGTVKEVFHAKFSNGKPTFINIGKSYPDSNRVTAVIWEEDRGKFPSSVKKKYLNKVVCVTGVIEIIDDGSISIKVSSPSQIKIIK